jgi:TFIIS helical bundle-like domain
MADPKDVLRQIRVAKDAAVQAQNDEDGTAHVSRCCDVLKLLQTTAVTADLLASTGAGKAVRKLMTHPNEQIKAAAGQVVAVWKSSVSKQLAASAPTARPAPAGAAAQPAFASHPMDATATAAQPASAPAAPEQPRLVSDPASTAAATAAVVSDAIAHDARTLRRQESDAAPAPSKPRAPFAQPPDTGDASRDGICKGLATAIATAVLDEYEDVESPHMLAAAIEDAAFMRFGSISSGSEYKAKVSCRTVPGASSLYAAVHLPQVAGQEAGRDVAM